MTRVQPSFRARLGVGLMLTSIINFSCILGLALQWQWVGEEFRKLFRSFGAELPAITRFIVTHTLATAVLLGMLAAAHAIALLSYVRRRTEGLRTATKLFIWLEMAVLALLVASIYLPIFNLGQMV